MVGATVAATATATAPAEIIAHMQSTIESPIRASTASSEPALPEFSPKICLFCNRTSTTLAANCAHMTSRHGLLIPDEADLLVDRDTLLGYLHLVIHEFHECLWCRTTRSSSRAIQQHMIDQDHCQANFEAEGGEYNEFFRSHSESESDAYDGDSDTDRSFTDEEDAASPTRLPGSHTGTEDTFRLPSGKIIMNRNADTRSRDHRPHASASRSAGYGPARNLALPGQAYEAAENVETETMETETETNPAEPNAPMSKALNKQERRNTRLALQVAGVRASDRTALAHLLPAEKRALLAGAQKQVARAGREEQHFRTKMDKLGNIKSKERFVNDVPGGKSHKNRFMAQ